MKSNSMMRTFSSFIFLVLVFSCSDDSIEQPESDNQTDDEIIIEEENMPEEEEEQENEIDATIPFDISVILKEFQGNGTTDGVYYSIDFNQLGSQASELKNITEELGLEVNAYLAPNGSENILSFSQGENSINQKYVSLRLDTRELNSLNTDMVFSDDFTCSLPGPTFSWNSENFFAYRYNFCVEQIELLVRTYDTGLLTELPPIEDSYIGDSFHQIWGTEDYFLVQFNSFFHEGVQNFRDRDGLAVYNAKSFEIILLDTTPLEKTIRIDRDKILVITRNEGMEIIDLSTTNVEFSTEVVPNMELNPTIVNTSIVNGKVGLVVFQGTTSTSYPSYFDFNANEIIMVNQESYDDFLNRQGSDINSNSDLIQPTDFKFDMESETFAFTYAIGDRISSQPRAYGLVFMNFDGEVLFQYDFPNIPFVTQQILRR